MKKTSFSRRHEFDGIEPFFVILVVKNGSVSVYKRMKYIKLY